MRRNLKSRTFLIVLAALVMILLPTRSHPEEEVRYLVAGKLGEFKKALEGEKEGEEKAPLKTEVKTAGKVEEEGEEKKEEGGKLKEFWKEIKPPKKKSPPRETTEKRIIITDPWYWDDYLGSWSRYELFRDYYRDLYLRGLITYDEYQALLDRFWYAGRRRTYYRYPYVSREVPVKRESREKRAPQSEKELRLSLTHQFAGDISSQRFSFYYLGQQRVALEVAYADYREEVNGRDHLQQIDVIGLYQLYSEEAQFLIGAGGRAYYGNGNQWGVQLGIETEIPLSEQLTFSLSPRIAFVSDEVITEWEGKISWRVIDYLSLILGYRSLSLPAEDLNIEGLHIGLALVF